ncbi:OmpH/Skp family outer membrane protein [Salidesulfovibrio brasiliensis]|uniref:OmpH family outer membrane protein n=1 Tax=Salidesulfovibrio brasiliensis TaxID=221711 RepID=UPI0006D14454|nr:OmpH family outer membrane protein [Salidesulfovibrio brasiliensis]
MKKIVVLSFAMLLLFAASAQAGKIAIVNSIQAVSESKAGQSVGAEVNKKKSAYEAEVKAQQEKVNNLKKRLQQMGAQYQSGMIKEDQLRKAQQEYASAGAQLNVLGEMSTMNFKKDVQKLQAPIKKLFLQVVNKYAKEQGFDVVIDVVRGGVAYADDSVNITDVVIKEMDKQWKK